MNQICFWVFLFAELSLQSEPGHGHPAPAAALPQLRDRAGVFFPQGLQLLSPDGTFHNLISPFHLVTAQSAQDHFYIGIMQPNRVLRPFFFRHTMVKVREDGPENFEIVPLTMQEFLHYPFNRNLTPYNLAVRYIAGVGNQENGRERG